MDPVTQKGFIYLLERIHEPLYLGPKGGGNRNVYYHVPTDDLVTIKIQFISKHLNFNKI